MEYKIGEIEFDGETTIAEVEQKIRTKQEFKDFAKESFKTKEIQAQEIIDELNG